jgi:hypothetical protein
LGEAKSILLRPISARVANDLVRRLHYSGKVVNNSQFHVGVYYRGRLEGALQFGPSLDKRKTKRLVTDTPWNGFLELNRMAFSDELPRNSESRALGISFRLLKEHRPDIQWVVSFADATQCGDGTIYRAAGFVLTMIRKNSEVFRVGDEIVHTMTLKSGKTANIMRRLEGVPVAGYQLRYIYFLDPSAKDRLTVPIIPFSKIDEVGAGMYKGKKRNRADGVNGSTSEFHSEGDGSNPISALHSKESP